MMGTVYTIIQNFTQLFKWWVVISPWEQAVRVRLGKQIKVLDAGVHLRIPFADIVYLQSTRLRLTLLPTQTLITKDGKALTVAGNVGYTIDNILKLYMSLHHAQDTLVAMAQQAIASSVCRSSSDVLSPDALGKAASESLNFESYGLGEAQVNITDFAFVRTYRLISDQRWGGAGDYLTTNSRLGGTA